MKCKTIFFYALLVFLLALSITSPSVAASRDPTWGVKVDEVYEYKMETCRIKGNVDNANYTIYYNSTDYTNNLVAQEGDTWKVTVKNTNTSGIYGTITYKDVISPIHYICEFFLDTHSDNSTYWQDEADSANNEKNSSIYSTEEYTLSGSRGRTHVVFVDQSWIEQYTSEIDTSKGVYVLQEEKYNESCGVAQYHGNDHYKYICTTLGVGGGFIPGYEGFIALLAVSIVAVTVISRRKKL